MRCWGITQDGSRCKMRGGFFLFCHHHRNRKQLLLNWKKLLFWLVIFAFPFIAAYAGLYQDLIKPLFMESREELARKALENPDIFRSLLEIYRADTERLENWIEEMGQDGRERDKTVRELREQLADHQVKIQLLEKAQPLLEKSVDIADIDDDEIELLSKIQRLGKPGKPIHVDF